MRMFLHYVLSYCLDAFLFLLAIYLIETNCIQLLDILSCFSSDIAGQLSKKSGFINRILSESRGLCGCVIS